MNVVGFSAYIAENNWPNKPVTVANDSSDISAAKTNNYILYSFQNFIVRHYQVWYEYIYRRGFSFTIIIFLRHYCFQTILPPAAAKWTHKNETSTRAMSPRYVFIVLYITLDGRQQRRTIIIGHALQSSELNVSRFVIRTIRRNKTNEWNERFPLYPRHKHYSKSSVYPVVKR